MCVTQTQRNSDLLSLSYAYAWTSVDECSIEELFEAMDLPWDGFESELHNAVSDVLDRMEAGNKVMYREGLIHLIC